MIGLNTWTLLNTGIAPKPGHTLTQPAVQHQHMHQCSEASATPKIGSLASPYTPGWVQRGAGGECRSEEVKELGVRCF